MQYVNHLTLFVLEIAENMVWLGFLRRSIVLSRIFPYPFSSASSFSNGRAQNLLFEAVFLMVFI